MGTCYLTVEVKEKEITIKFEIRELKRSSLLGVQACEILQLVKRIYSSDRISSNCNNQIKAIIQRFPHVFHGIVIGIGISLPFESKIQLRTIARPVIHPPRSVPAPLRECLKMELECIQQLGIIAKGDEPTDWVSSMVCVKKANGDLKICLDPKDLNQNIKREHCPIPKREEIMSEMSGAKIFIKLDASRFLFGN
ncbi:hypothetical protein scyTo_0001353 [Scyliorhinus torazame]|uniref:Uncharacterized protein n=1 Tax=Scyliorhinus torazame TaxID=75743 RepID=A0A401PC70_SCYTO|nr:hypothetical protein [Scyliorhinus torazame]